MDDNDVVTIEFRGISGVAGHTLPVGALLRVETCEAGIVVLRRMVPATSAPTPALLQPKQPTDIPPVTASVQGVKP